MTLIDGFLEGVTDEQFEQVQADMNDLKTYRIERPGFCYLRIDFYVESFEITGGGIVVNKIGGGHVLINGQEAIDFIDRVVTWERGGTC